MPPTRYTVEWRREQTLCELARSPAVAAAAASAAAVTEKPSAVLRASSSMSAQRMWGGLAEGEGTGRGRAPPGSVASAPEEMAGLGALSADLMRPGSGGAGG